MIALVLCLQIYSNGFTDFGRCKDEIGFLRKLWCGITGTYEDDAPFFRSLPSDEEMIANFRKHRADFERLVQIYREDLSVPNDEVGVLLPSAEVKKIMDRIRVAQCRAMAWRGCLPIHTREILTS